MKRILSLLLGLILILGLLNLPALAASDQDYTRVYRWNLAIFNARLSDAETLAEYLYTDFDPDFVEHAQSIVQGKSSKMDMAKAIHGWTAENIWYDYDALYGRFTPTEEPSDLMRGWCGLYAGVATDLLQAVGIPARGVAGYTLWSRPGARMFMDIQNGTTDHAWVEAFVDGKWIIMDPTWDSPNKYEYGIYSPQGKTAYKWFNVSLEDLSHTHGYEIFYDSGVESVTLPPGMTYINDRLLYRGNINTPFYEKLRKITVPDTVTRIGSSAFQLCVGLEDINIPNSVTEIGPLAFAECENLTNIVIPRGVTKIESQTFAGCTGLASIVIPDSVIEIESRAFSECRALTSVVIPNSVTTIGFLAFYNCVNLVSIVIPRSVTHINSAMLMGANRNLTIYGRAGSAAESFAKTEGYRFVDGNPAIDTADPWAKSGINSAAAKGFIPFDLQDDYKDIITREEFCRMAVKWVEVTLNKDIDVLLMEKSETLRQGTFRDTDDPVILAAYKLGITSGEIAPTADRPGTFNPGGQFNREQAATMIMNTVRVIGADVGNPPMSDFTDMNLADNWAHPGINFVRAHGIMSGVTSSPPFRFDPKATFTRQQSIVTFNNIDTDTLPGDLLIDFVMIDGWPFPIEWTTDVNLSWRNLSNEDIKPLKRLVNLKALDLSGNPRITDISPLAELINLTSLDLNATRINDITPLSGLTNLQRLLMLSGRVSDVSALAGLTKLELLDLGFNQIKEVDALANLKNLTFLSLFLNQVNDIGSLAGLVKLTDLNLSLNRIRDVSALAGMANLNVLILNDNRVDDISKLNGLTNLTELRLANNRIGNINALAGMTKLDCLFLSGNQISDVSALAKMTNLTMLELNRNQITALSGLAGLAKLEFLSLGFNRINDLGALAGLSGLHTLSLERNQIRDISALTGLKGLQTLYLYDTPLTDIRDLANLTGLEFLGLPTGINSDQVEWLRARLPNCAINISTFAW
jgi:internalin A